MEFLSLAGLSKGLGGQDHFILLQQRADGYKTFRIYPTIDRIQETLVDMHSKYYDNAGAEDKSTSFFNWMDSFTRLEAFRYEQKIGQYHRVSREQLKNTFEKVNEQQEPDHELEILAIEKLDLSSPNSEEDGDR